MLLQERCGLVGGGLHQEALSMMACASLSRLYPGMNVLYCIERLDAFDSKRIIIWKRLAQQYSENFV
jgi:hypothetical protein